jgi:hypothetical protein
VDRKLFLVSILGYFIGDIIFEYLTKTNSDGNKLVVHRAVDFLAFCTISFFSK